MLIISIVDSTLLAPLKILQQEKLTEMAAIIFRSAISRVSPYLDKYFKCFLIMCSSFLFPCLFY